MPRITGNCVHHELLLVTIMSLMSVKPEAGSKEALLLELLSDACQKYEDTYYPQGFEVQPTPQDNKGLTQADWRKLALDAYNGWLFGNDVVTPMQAIRNVIAQPFQR